jgi:O-methyltransferase involved in polyketide biosynthesis
MVGSRRREKVPSVTDQYSGPPQSGIDTSVPHSARIWNYWLGGKDNYEADRIAGDQWLATAPEIRDIARASREFLARAVRHLVEQEGVRQFLDVGTGLPTADNTHEVAQRHAPEARIVYVDHDPLVLAHARALLTSTPQGATRYVDADMRDTAKILAEAAEVLDLSQPTALLFMGVLGHVADHDEARTLVRTLLDALSPGSFLVICDGSEAEAIAEAEQDYAESGAIPYVNRSRAEVAAFFEGLEWVEPGLVNVNLWRPAVQGVDAATGQPQPAPEPINAFAGVARKP